MNTKLPEPAPVISMSKGRRSALMGAAASALIVAAPAIHAAPGGMSVQAAVRQAMGAAPLRILLDNDDPIVVPDNQSGISESSPDEDINIVNSGDITGGIGIDVSTGANDLSDVVSDTTQSFTVPGFFVGLYDDFGQPVIDSYGYQTLAATAEFTYSTRATILNRDPLASKVTVENSGDIRFAASHGIRAANPAGESITIRNSGDITALQDSGFRSGIYASTETFRRDYTTTQTATGELSYNAYGQVNGVVSLDQFSVEHSELDMEYDGGSIRVENAGDIDMGDVAQPPGFGGPTFVAAGIHTKGDGGTTIINSGDIRVDRWSTGIHASSTATTDISNSGRISIGNHSTGISIAPSEGSAGDYRLGGDISVLNTGDIVGGVRKGDLGPYETAYAAGIAVDSRGSNNEYLAALAHYNELFSRYNEALGTEEFELYDIPNTRLYDTRVTNRGRIELADGAAGIKVVPWAGRSTVVNEGTIIVGDGTSLPQYNFESLSAGISQVNFSVNGRGTTTSINAESGVIIAGDESAGIQNLNLGGSSVAINHGSITTGDGVSTLIDDGSGNSYDRLFHSLGIRSVSAARAMGTTSYALNTGNVTVGQLAIGMLVSGQGTPLVDATAITAAGSNEGTIVAGDNSAGMFSAGTNAIAHNSGQVTTGDYDISSFQPHAEYTADEFAQLRAGVAATGWQLSEVRNQGVIATGDGTIGAAARLARPGFGVASAFVQDETGTITTGDRAVGVVVAGNYEAAFLNDGGIRVGHDSTGVDVSAGSAILRYGDTMATVIEGSVFAANTGIIESGDRSVGIRLNAVHEDVGYSGIVLVPNPDTPYYYDEVPVSGSVDVIGSAYLVNTGRVRAGANSTAVEIAGAAGEEGGLQLFNRGTIEAGTAGTAVAVNAGNGIGSYIVNVGTISGDIRFGDGDDRLVHTSYLDRSGRVVSSGEIRLAGSTIDFGAGENRFEIDRATVTVLGGENLIRGADVVMNRATIEARNGTAGSRLTIDGNVSGSFVFGADIAAQGADVLAITGDVAAGSSIGVTLNPVSQLSGEHTIRLISIEGENRAGAPAIAGVTGRFADSLVDAQASFVESTGEVVVSATFGMGHIATAAASSTTMAQNWWMQSVGSYDQRNMQRLAGAQDAGPSLWGAGFHEEGTVRPQNALQDTSFDQQLSGLQAGMDWTWELPGGHLSVGPMFTYGNARANLNANLSSSTGDAWAYGLNATFALQNGFYVDATWQDMTMNVDLRAPGTATDARGTTEATGDGFNIETGYAFRMASGLTLVPQLQYSTVDAELDGFDSSDDTYHFTGIGGKASLLRAGLSLSRKFDTANGYVIPLVDVDYLYLADGESTLVSNGVGFATDTSGSGYRVEFGLAGRYHAWNITGRVGLSDTSRSDQMLSANLNVRYSW